MSPNKLREDAPSTEPLRSRIGGILAFTAFLTAAEVACQPGGQTSSPEIYEINLAKVDPILHTVFLIGTNGLNNNEISKELKAAEEISAMSFGYQAIASAIMHEGGLPTQALEQVKAKKIINDAQSNEWEAKQEKKLSEAIEFHSKQYLSTESTVALEAAKNQLVIDNLSPKAKKEAKRLMQEEGYSPTMALIWIRSFGR